MPIIKAVCPGGPADIAGLKKNDRILAIQGQPIKDYLDFLFYSSEPSFLMTIMENATGITKDIWLEPGYGNLGVTLDGIIYDELKSCHNKCLFCFVEQGHPNSRPSLCIKDDDYRFSFLQGSYITLTNMQSDDFKRIAQMSLSPLYISVHTTNDELRMKMMRNKKAAGIMERLTSLLKAGIFFHTQIVVCPGYNDGLELENTLRDLASLGNNVLSIGVVPVGLTRFREKLTYLRAVDNKVAKEILQSIRAWQKKFLAKRAERVVFAADELYWLAQEPLPNSTYYEDYPLLENGIGLTRDFRSEGKEALLNYKKNNNSEVKSFGIATSVMGEWAWKPVLSFLRQKYNLDIKLVVVENKYFGPDVTVSGLLTAEDLYETLKKEELPEKVFIPAIMFNDDGQTLDGHNLDYIKGHFPKNDLIVAGTIEDVLILL